MSKRPHSQEQGPFRAAQLHEGDRYELSRGHPVYCAPGGREHAGTSLTGAAVVETDPDVEWAGVDPGFTPEPGTLRAPDVAVAAAGTEQGWIPGVPPLAIEYAGPGQDEQDLETKIGELLAGGTHQVWVVRLVGPRRVEVHRAGKAVHMAGPGERLEAPGILRNPVVVEALYDRDAGHRAVLHNLLQREGYEDLEAVRIEGREVGREEGREAGREEGRAAGIEEGRGQGIRESILALLAERGLNISTPVRERIHACRDPGQLKRWMLAAARVDAAERIFE